MAWGYPRQITRFEIDEGTWFTNEIGILWFVQPVMAGAEVPECFVGALVIHGIGDPRRSGRAINPDSLRLIEDLGRELGARKLYSVLPVGRPDVPALAMRRYLRRYGWLEDEWGAYKVLVGGTAWA
jgi:hypothetical protein